MKLTPIRILLLNVLVFFALTLSAQEKHVKKSDLPPAVQKAADEQRKGATVKRYSKEIEDGKVAYEVELLANGHSKDVTMDSQGNVLEVEEEVSLDSLSPAVRHGLQEKAGKGKIGKVEGLTKHGTLVAYEAQVLTTGKRSEIQVAPDGKPLDHKE